MSTRYVERLVEERDSLATQILSLADKAASENRSLTESESTAATNMRAKVDSLDAEIRTWSSTSDAFAKFAQISAPGDEKREQAKSENTALSLGEQFVRSAAYRQYGYHGSSSPWESRAAIVTTSAPGAAFMTADTSYQIRPPEFQTPLLSVSNQVAVSSNTVEYASYGPAPEAGGPIAEGVAKTEATLAATPITASLGTYAHWVSVSRQALEDSAQLRSWIDGSLTRGVDRKIENSGGAALVAATLPPATGTDLLQAIRAGVGVVQAAGYQPNAVVLNPADWAALDNTVMGGTSGGPVVNQTFWGLRPVASAGVAVGNAYVGDFQVGTALFHRGQTAVYITDSHADSFIKNLFTVLAERRALYRVTVPEALAHATVAP